MHFVFGYCNGKTPANCPILIKLCVVRIRNFFEYNLTLSIDKLSYLMFYGFHKTSKRHGLLHQCCHKILFLNHIPIFVSDMFVYVSSKVMHSN